MSDAEIVFGLVATVGLVASFGLGVIAGCVRWDLQRRKVRRLSHSVRVLGEQLDTAETDLSEERRLVDSLAVDLADRARALRAAVADPAEGGVHHMAIARIREIAARPLPGESTGAHATTEETDRG